MTKKETLNIVKEAIDACDPEGFLNLGAPKDEYLLEANIITDRLLVSEMSHLPTIIQETFFEYLGAKLRNELEIQIVNRVKRNLELYRKIC